MSRRGQVLKLSQPAAARGDAPSRTDPRSLWARLRGYGELLRDRASGAAPEMESAKSLCRRLEARYRPGLSVLDVGCGAGHYLRSLRRRLDPEIDYTGVDLTVEFLAMGRNAFGPVPHLAAAEVLALPFPDRSFDLVVCSNLLLHLPPPPGPVLGELARIARELVLVRTPVGERNYVIQEVREPEELMEEFPGSAPGGSGAHAGPRDDDPFDASGAPRHFNHFNLYTKEYLAAAARRAAPGCHIRLEPDRCFEPFDNRSRTTATGTRVAGGHQVAGNLLLDWWWLEASRPEAP